MRLYLQIILNRIVCVYYILYTCQDLIPVAQPFYKCAQLLSLEVPSIIRYHFLFPSLNSGIMPRMFAPQANLFFEVMEAGVLIGYCMFSQTHTRELKGFVICAQLIGVSCCVPGVQCMEESITIFSHCGLLLVLEGGTDPFEGLFRISVLQLVQQKWKETPQQDVQLAVKTEEWTNLTLFKHITSCK